jgi:hypothetical protein
MGKSPTCPNRAPHDRRLNASSVLAIFLWAYGWLNAERLHKVTEADHNGDHAEDVGHG